MTFIILGALFFTSVLMCAALALAWSSFGHPRHAASWAASFGVSAVQSLVNMVALVTGKPAPLMALAFLLVALPGPFVAMGARQRARRPSRWRWFTAATVGEILFLLLSIGAPALRPIGWASGTLFSAVCIGIAAAAIRPVKRAPRPAERAMMLALATLSAVECVAGVLTALRGLEIGGEPVTAAYHLVLAILIPPAVVSTGVAAILLVASDLAADLSRLASRDPLTALYNRRGFQENAIRLLANARRFHLPVTLVLADIDHFKAINDRYGHTAGDHVLCFIAERLSGGVRQGDLVARIGGEEFALLLVDVGVAQAGEAVERIRSAIALGYAWEGETIPVTASFGLGVVTLPTGDLEALLATAFDRADQALYRSKVDGRDRVTLAA